MGVFDDPREPLSPEFDRRPTGRLEAPAAEQKIELARPEPRYELAGRAARDFHCRPGAGASETSQYFGQTAPRVALVDGEPDGLVRRPGLQRSQYVLIESEQLASAFDQLFAVRRELDAATLPARNQSPADKGFKPLHLQRHRRLGASDALGSAREILILSDEHEGAHEIEIERRRRGHE